MTTFVLVHSPLVGPATWRPAADVLRARGHRAIVPPLTHVLDGPAPYVPALTRAVADFVAESVADSVADVDAPVAVVGHSGAGPLLPAIAEALPVPITATVFVDAGLPHAGHSWFDTAPPELADHLRSIAKDRMLPPWHEWFPPEATAELVPDPALREILVRELRPMPVAFFEEPVPTSPDLPPDRCAYLRLSDGYADAARAAAALGWPVVTHDSHHLALYTDPGPVAEKLLTLVIG